MAPTHRQPTTALVENLLQEGHSYAFFQVVEILLRDLGYEVEERALEKQAPEGLRFRVAPHLGFPAGDVASVTRESEEDDAFYNVLVTFLGLHGASSPLPSHFLETAAWSSTEEGVQTAFNDFFSDRLIWLFYLIWRKYRYYIRYSPDATDQFSGWMFSLIGIGSSDARQHGSVPWSRLLTYLGVIAARTRSAPMIAGVIAHAFGLQAVSIRELEMRTVMIPESQLCRGGIMNCALGEDMSIGDRIEDVSAKFTIVLHDLDFKRCRDFLPSGNDFNRLRELVDFLLKDQMAYDIEMHLSQQETPEFELGHIDRGRLGWTTFLGNSGLQGRAPIVLSART